MPQLRKRAQDWTEYRRLWRRWRMGFEHYEPVKPPREARIPAPTAAEGEAEAGPPLPSAGLEPASQDLGALSYRELQKLAAERLGIKPVGMKRDELVRRIQGEEI